MHPIVFNYPFRQVQEIQIHLPEGLAVADMLKPVDFSTEFGRIKTSLTTAGNVVSYRFEVVFNATHIPASEYQNLRQFQREWVGIGQKQIIFNREALN